MNTPPMDSLLAGLNDAQRSAVTSPASVLQVLAPPGSGKTKTLTARVAYLVAQGLRPWNIIVCTFTIKAAREMGERIRNHIGDEVEKKLILGTFHSVARRFLVSYGHHINIPKNFGIADTSDSKAIVNRIIKRRGYGADPGKTRSRISTLKAKCISCDAHAATQKSAEQQEFASIYMEYEEILKMSSLLDYDDLLLRCAELLKRRPECVSNIEAVLIDEFQDTNQVQFELMQLLAQHSKTITTVGDPDQSIYGWRSAEIENLNRMRKLYPETHVANLEENYRSSGAILLSAQEVIEQDESRPAKKLQPTHCSGATPILRRLPSAAAEASWLVTEIQRTKALTGQLYNNDDFAILLRSAHLSRHIESALGKAGIPYRMVGGSRFFDRVEVKIILDYLRVISQPDHNDAVARIVNLPSRRVGNVTVNSLLAEAETKQTTLWTMLLSIAQGNKRPETKLSAQTLKGIEAFVSVILESSRKLSAEEDRPCSLIELVEHILKNISLEDYIRKTYADEFDARWANVAELIAQAADFSATALGSAYSTQELLPIVEGIEQRGASGNEDVLCRFLANVTLASATEMPTSEEGDGTVQQVTISTIHAAKGLEWPVVFIPGAYEGSIPHSRSEDTDEERRLLYVGMTRAQSLLYISYPTKNSQREKTSLSTFLSPTSMIKYFAVRGPSFNFTTSQDLARILRRTCPTEMAMHEGCLLVERVEDDRWPLDGEEEEPERSFIDFSNPSSDAFPYNFQSKRRKIDVKIPVAGYSTSITMQDQGAYSTAAATLSTGFVSAGTRMRELEQQVQEQKTVKKTTMLRRSQTEIEVVAETKETTAQCTTRQGSITTFFTKKSAAVSVTSSAPANQGGQIVPKARSKPILSSFQRSAPLNDISNVAAKAAAPPPSLPRSLSDHKLRMKPMLGRPPQVVHEEEEESSTKYVLLSSSPQKPDDEELYSRKQPENGTSPPVTTAKAAQGATTLRSTSDFKPATTFHTTSMAQTAIQPAPQRKTLGMRRSLHGWNGRPNQQANANPPGRPR
ncbi:ATP-dependent DNA helicase srs2 [Coniosporium apollinis]|uniref:DNA 3'-5' helicase n=1 Tax=Coniosporium apollinis TaxID=61459 RepID=A0ABQ9NLZ5_9PEZI|nr:ATP-dependent DNA helicase srs2 [Coniosporium apollinis]